MAGSIEKRGWFRDCRAGTLNSLTGINSLVLAALDPRSYFSIAWEKSSARRRMLNSDGNIFGKVYIVLELISRLAS